MKFDIIIEEVFKIYRETLGSKIQIDENGAYLLVGDEYVRFLVINNKSSIVLNKEQIDQIVDIIFTYNNYTSYLRDKKIDGILP